MKNFFNHFPYLLICTLFAFANMKAQDQKRQLEHADFAIWNTLRNVQISADGKYALYRLEPHEGNSTVHLVDVEKGTGVTFSRASDARFSADSKHLIFKLSPDEEHVKDRKRAKTKKADMPGDTLVIYKMADTSQQMFPGLQSIKVASDWPAPVLATFHPKATENDTTKKKSKAKKYSQKNGYLLLAIHLDGHGVDSLDYVTSFEMASHGPGAAAITKGRDSTLQAGVYALGDAGWHNIKSEDGDYCKLSYSRDGSHLAFYGAVDTAEHTTEPQTIFLLNGADSAGVFATDKDQFVPEGWRISENAPLQFSKNSDHLYFGLAPVPYEEDTTVLDEEIVNVEVWHYQDERLYTQQSVRAANERKRTYLAVARLDNGSKHLIASKVTPLYRTAPDLEADQVILYDESPYLREMSWRGRAFKDVYVSDLMGSVKLLKERVDGTPSVAPNGQFAHWYSRSDSAWMIADLSTMQISRVGLPTAQYRERFDAPDDPYPYGVAGWTENNEHLLVYDRFDIWAVNPHDMSDLVNLTNGRDSQTRYRYINLDREIRYVDTQKPALLHVFNETSKHSGYAHLDVKSGTIEVLIEGPRLYTTRPIKAQDADVLLFTQESFVEFPDLYLTADNFTSTVRISDANPQQANYSWGDAELFSWTAYDGKELQGLLIKPAGFDPSKKYPLIVNFYERSTDGLYTHRAPYPHRSTINYAFYASRGYVIFNPDVHYDVGHPGGSAYNCVVSGTEALIAEGFVDAERVGVQGHSWGGYQIADLITRTDIFACAESGAPVVNMVSAYGGIRWQTGLSRMFQYEHTQSRLGASLWENRELYLENSPIFNLDKVTTPVLIMHNDQDGHVPWYQGIEFFVAMRRLGQPAWFLNYNGEPHWPLKRQNRKDFNIRMQQFFDHYLMNAPMPKWMRDGVPAVDKGIHQGYELIDRISPGNSKLRPARGN